MDAAKSPRLASLDQFRGYTVVGMLLVNYISHFNFAKPTILSHHNTFCSYADTIMPHFLFAVGFAFRLVWLKTVARAGTAAAVKKVVTRCLSLILLGIVVYGTDFKFASMSDFNSAIDKNGWFRVFCSGFERNPFQTLTHIGVTSLFVLPVIGAHWGWRLAWLIGSFVLHYVLSNNFYFDWVMARPGIDGGPLGFLTWTAPLLLGSFAHDAILQAKPPRFGLLLILSIVFMAVGYGMSCLSMTHRLVGNEPLPVSLVEPPFFPPAVKEIRSFSPKYPPEPKSEVTMVPNYWMMSQRAGTPSYLIFSAGFSLLVYLGFVLLSDRLNVQIPIFRTFGSNALAAYLLHPIVAETIKKATPGDTTEFWGWVSFAVYLLINWMFIRGLERGGIHIRL